MDYALLYGFLFWLLLMAIGLGILYAVSFLYSRYTGRLLQHNRYHWVGLLMAIGLVLVILSLYVSKQLGIGEEFRRIAKIAGVAFWVFLVANLIVTLFKRFKNK